MRSDPDFLARSLSRLAPAVALAIALTASWSAAAQTVSSRFVEEARDLEAIRTALELERPSSPPPASVTGVSVPHHMLAADLIARGLWAASSGHYSRVVVISPDHFHALNKPFGVTTGDLKTVMGTAAGDPDLSAALIGDGSFFSDIGSAEQEHGLWSVLPFARAIFPEAELVGITAATSTGPEEWEKAAKLIAALVGPETLIVQSTDYSHHLPVGAAVLRDQETLAAIATGEPESAERLNQPAHLDSSAAQYIQMWLQRHVRHAKPVVVANRNSSEYAPVPGETTSYVVTVYTAAPEDGASFRYSDQTIAFFAGDLLAGRGSTEILADQRARDAVVGEILRRTGGARLLVNLEGVMLEERPAGMSDSQLFMEERLAVPLMRDIRTFGASLANNHAWDLGEEGLEETARLLEKAGIRALRHGEIADLGAFRLLPLTFKRSYFYDHPAIRTQEQLAAACEVAASPPLLVFAHWGGDYVDMPDNFERAVLETLGRCGVSALIGAHSHKASQRVDLAAGGALQSVFSLGNFLFDQGGEKASGGLVEVRVFKQGTVALRPVPLPNLYEIGLEVLRSQ